MKNTKKQNKRAIKSDPKKNHAAYWSTKQKDSKDGTRKKCEN